jgi:hypothetical protein
MGALLLQGPMRARHIISGRQRLHAVRTGFHGFHEGRRRVRSLHSRHVLVRSRIERLYDLPREYVRESNRLDRLRRLSNGLGLSERSEWLHALSDWHVRKPGTRLYRVHGGDLLRRPRVDELRTVPLGHLVCGRPKRLYGLRSRYFLFQYWLERLHAVRSRLVQCDARSDDLRGLQMR